MAEKKTTEKIITALMLTYAMDREQAKLFLEDHEGNVLSEEIQLIQRMDPPVYLRGWFSYGKRMEWLSGRNEAINVLFSRFMRGQVRATMHREMELAR